MTQNSSICLAEILLGNNLLKNSILFGIWIRNWSEGNRGMPRSRRKDGDQTTTQHRAGQKDIFIESELETWAYRGKFWHLEDQWLKEHHCTENGRFKIQVISPVDKLSKYTKYRHWMSQIFDNRNWEFYTYWFYWKSPKAYFCGKR